MMILATLVLAAVGHAVIVVASPYLMMRRQMRIHLASRSANQLSPGRRASADVRTAARRPNADMLMSNAVFDLRKGPLRFSSPVPRDYYWSVSFFGANSVCFRVFNQADVASDAVDIRLILKGAEDASADDAQVVTSPSKRGIVVIRQAIPSAEAFADVAALQNRATLSAVADLR
jgi:uncharacterized membrane protein